MNSSEIKSKLENARSKLQETRKLREQHLEVVRQLEITEASWFGFIEALTPYENIAETPSDLELS